MFLSFVLAFLDLQYLLESLVSFSLFFRFLRGYFIFRDQQIFAESFGNMPESVELSRESGCLFFMLKFVSWVPMRTFATGVVAGAGAQVLGTIVINEYITKPATARAEILAAEESKRTEIYREKKLAAIAKNALTSSGGSADLTVPNNKGVQPDVFGLKKYTQTLLKSLAKKLSKTMEVLKSFFLDSRNKLRLIILNNLSRYSFKSHNLKDVYLLAERFYKLSSAISLPIYSLFLFAGIFSTATFYCMSLEQDYHIILVLRGIARGFFCLGVWCQYRVDVRIFKENLAAFTGSEQLILKNLILIKGVYRITFILLNFFIIIIFIQFSIEFSKLKILSMQLQHATVMAEYDKELEAIKQNTSELLKKCI